MVILDDSSFTIEYANTVPETKLLFSIAHELGHLILHFLEDNGSDKLKMEESVNIGEVEEYDCLLYTSTPLRTLSTLREFVNNGLPVAA